MLPFDRNSIDAAVEGALVDKTPKAKTSISRMVENSQNFCGRTLESNNFSSIDNSLKDQVNLLSKLFSSLIKGEVPKVGSHEVYHMIGHHNDQCPNLKDVSAMNSFERNNQQSNTYISEWSDHPNFRWGPQDQKPLNTFSSSSSSQGQGMYLEERVSKLALTTNSIKTDFEKHLAMITKQIGNATESIRKEMHDYILRKMLQF